MVARYRIPAGLPALGRAVLGVSVALMAATCSKSDARPPRPSVPVTVAAVQQRSVPYEISAIGTVTPIQTVSVRS